MSHVTPDCRCNPLDLPEEAPAVRLEHHVERHGQGGQLPVVDVAVVQLARLVAEQSPPVLRPAAAGLTTSTRRSTTRIADPAGGDRSRLLPRSLAAGL
jgi:hypothetical protein